MHKNKLELAGNDASKMFSDCEFLSEGGAHAQAFPKNKSINNILDVRQVEHADNNKSSDFSNMFSENEFVSEHGDQIQAIPPRSLAATSKALVQQKFIDQELRKNGAFSRTNDGIEQNQDPAAAVLNALPNNSAKSQNPSEQRMLTFQDRKERKIGSR